MTPPNNCIFCRIARHEIKTALIHEDDSFMAFQDHAPKAPVHFLLVPKQHIVSLQQVTPDQALLLGTMLTHIPRLAEAQGCRPGPEGGFRTVINSGADGGQEVSHLHIHVMGGPRPWSGA